MRPAVSAARISWLNGNVNFEQEKFYDLRMQIGLRPEPVPQNRERSLQSRVR